MTDSSVPLFFLAVTPEPNATRCTVEARDNARESMFEMEIEAQRKIGRVLSYQDMAVIREKITETEELLFRDTLAISKVKQEMYRETTRISMASSVIEHQRKLGMVHSPQDLAEVRRKIVIWEERQYQVSLQRMAPGECVFFW